MSLAVVAEMLSIIASIFTLLSLIRKRKEGEIKLGVFALTLVGLLVFFFMGFGASAWLSYKNLMPRSVQVIMLRPYEGDSVSSKITFTGFATDVPLEEELVLYVAPQDEPKYYLHKLSISGTKKVCQFTATNIDIGSKDDPKGSVYTLGVITLENSKLNSILSRGEAVSNLASKPIIERTITRR